MPSTVADWILKSNGLFAHVDEDIGDRPLVLSPNILLGARIQDQTGDVMTKRGSDYPTMADFTAIGLVQSATVQQQKNLQQLYELGSHNLYTIQGRVNIRATLNRVLFDGHSLMRAMYGDSGTALELGDAGFEAENASVIINLVSQFLNKSIDLLFLFFNQFEEPMGGFYLENSYIHQHQLAFSSQQTMVVENIGLLASRIISLSV